MSEEQRPEDGPTLADDIKEAVLIERERWQRIVKVCTDGMPEGSPWLLQARRILDMASSDPVRSYEQIREEHRAWRALNALSWAMAECKGYLWPVRPDASVVLEGREFVVKRKGVGGGLEDESRHKSLAEAILVSRKQQEDPEPREDKLMPATDQVREAQAEEAMALLALRRICAALETQPQQTTANTQKVIEARLQAWKQELKEGRVAKRRMSAIREQLGLSPGASLINIRRAIRELQESARFRPHGPRSPNKETDGAVEQLLRVLEGQHYTRGSAYWEQFRDAARQILSDWAGQRDELRNTVLQALNLGPVASAERIAQEIAALKTAAKAAWAAAQAAATQALNQETEERLRRLHRAVEARKPHSLQPATV